jgi:hypothetical protein
MGMGLMGKAGKEYSLTYDEADVMTSILKQLTERQVSLDTASNRECEHWASLLKNNIERLRMISSKGKKFAVLEGTDVEALFSSGPYANWRRLIDPSDLAKTPEPLNEYWRESVRGFADFLESCGGLVPYPGNRGRTNPDD